MILLLDTSSPVTYLTIVDSDKKHDYSWESGRGLAKGLLEFITSKLSTLGKDIKDVDGFAIMKGPGSFTGLRIGATVLNTIAEFESIPIVGVTGDDWQDQARKLLDDNINHEIVIPEYGRPARITKPRK